MRFIFFIVVAVVAVLAGVVALQMSGGEQTTPQAVVQPQSAGEVSIKTADVLVAKADLPVGTIIDQSMVDIQPWPEHLVLNGFVLSTQGASDVVGKVVRSAVQAREPFLKSKLANPNDPGFLAAGLPAGMRAVTVATDTVSGVAGFVFPGDRVDLLFTHGISNISGKASTGKDSVAEVLAPNVRVLAVNLREAAASNGNGDEGGKPAAVQAPSSVTIEVSEAVAQQVRLAEKNGHISLSLRSIHDENSTVPAPTALTDLSKASSVDKAKGAELIVVRGPGRNGGKITSDVGVSSSINDGFGSSDVNQ